MPRKLRPYLEYQANQVETVLAAHRAPGRITGGTVGPRQIRFFLEPAPQVRLSNIRALADDLAVAMKVPSLRVARAEEGIVLEFPNPHPTPVSLLDLLAEVQPLPPATLVMGLTEAGLPLLARLSSPDVAHILVAGTTGSGKSALMRTMAASLVLSHSEEELRLVCLDPKGRTFQPLAGAPHFLRPPVRDMGEALEVLRSLVKGMEIRDRRGETPGPGVPHVVLLIDELADWVMLDSEKELPFYLTRLLQRGREAGIHVIAATQRPSAAVLGALMRANFPLRLVGKVVSPEDARIASGRGGTGAQLLGGQGEFLAVAGGAEPIRFQAAFAAEPELRQALGFEVPSTASPLRLPWPFKK